ncbi:hypothetical protein MOBT1_001414 [Malassezia obtusa]|uniref:Inositol polyphosphate-related phosphatase domain-containing protein n=1 Tax=Malassezia obtusa TaxID=76774 RepID=A0AAF0E055_9BASI|nr:hypothetical protein MOBT1_001414 [Malassezia obtusa]
MAAPPRAGAAAPVDQQASVTRASRGHTAHSLSTGASDTFLPPCPRPVRTQSDSGSRPEAPPPPPKTGLSHTRETPLLEPFVSAPAPPIARSLPRNVPLASSGSGTAPPLAPPAMDRMQPASMPGHSAQQAHAHDEPVRAEWSYGASRTPDTWFASRAPDTPRGPGRPPDVWYAERAPESATAEPGAPPPRPPPPRRENSSMSSLPTLSEGAVPVPPDAFLHMPLQEPSPEHAEPAERIAYHPPLQAAAGDATIRPTDSVRAARTSPEPRVPAPAPALAQGAAPAPSQSPVPAPAPAPPLHRAESTGSFAEPAPAPPQRPRIEIPPMATVPRSTPIQTPISEPLNAPDAAQVTPRTTIRRTGLEIPSIPPEQLYHAAPASERVRGLYTPVSEHARGLQTPVSEGARPLATPVAERPSPLVFPAAAETPRAAQASEAPRPSVVRSPAESGTSSPPSAVPPLVRAMDTSDTPTGSAMSSDSSSDSSSSDDEDGSELTDTALTTPAEASEMGAQDDMLDTSYLNRLAPHLDPPCYVPFKAHVLAGDLFGRSFVSAVQDKVRYVVRADAPQGFAERLFAQGSEHYAALGSPPNLSSSARELRISALAFCPPIAVSAGPDTLPSPSERGRFVWYGTANGNLGELDVHTGQLTAVRTNIHKERICLLQRVGHSMLVVDESGKISAWVPRHGRLLSLAQTTPHSQRITLPKHAHTGMVGDQLWVCSATLAPKPNGAPSAQRMLTVRVYNPLADDRPFNAQAQPLALPLTKENGIGNVVCSAVVPESPDTVYFGHDSGHISVWSVQTPACRDVHRVCDQPITALVGLNNMLWIGTRSGHITLYDVRASVWRAAKRWRAHRDAVTALLIDRYGVDPLANELVVCSVGNDYFAQFWDGFLTEDWTDSELRKSVAAFSTTRTLRVLELSFNIGAASPPDLFGVVDNMDLFQRVLRNSCSFSAPSEGEAGESCDAYSSPDVIVFGFQELIDLEDKRLTAKHLLLGNKRREGKENDGGVSSQHKAWHDQLVHFVRLVLPPESPYSVLLSESMVGLFSMVFVKSAITPRTRAATSYQVKTGLGGRYGNKGALVSRFIIDDTSFCFVNCHLAAGQRNVRQRNSDVNVIMQSAFPVAPPPRRDLAFARGGDGTMIVDHDICFIAGDLNYRIDMRRETVLNLIQQQRYDELTAADQLLAELRLNTAFRLRGFQEAPIHFPPTYKFNKRSNDWDSSEKARVPAYCDRILWRSSSADTVQCTSYKRWDATISDHRPVSATFRVRAKAIDPARLAQAVQKTQAECGQYKQRVLIDTLHYYLSL